MNEARPDIDSTVNKARDQRSTRPWLMALIMVTALVAGACSGSAGSEPVPETEGIAPAGPRVEPEPVEPEPVALRWLAVGDSYSSGEGLPDVEGGCDASPSAYAPLVSSETAKDWTVERFVFSACTGAVTADWDNQLQAWNDTLGEPEDAYGGPNLITATFGGNDIGFAATFLDCIGFDDGVELLEDPSKIDLGSAAEALFGRGCDISEDEIAERIDGLSSTLESLYESMSDTVGAEGTVFIIGYPAPIADPEQWMAGRCDGISHQDGQLLRRAAKRLNRVIEEATTIRANVHFVGVSEAFEGHGRCSPDEWIYGLADSLNTAEKEADGPLVDKARPFHPNQAGHRTMAAALRQALEAQFGR